MQTHPMVPSVKRTAHQLFSIFSISLLLISCKKGDTGPAGTAGATGSAGPTGTANVIYSDWFTPPSYTKDTVFGIYGYFYDKPATAITQKIIDSGTVITFGKLDGYVADVWPSAQTATLPITITYMETGTIYNDTWSALATAGNLRIQFVNDKDLYTSGITNTHQFRYIIIPGGVKTSGSVKSDPVTGNGNVLENPSASASLREVIKNHKQMGYAELCQRLGIPQ